MVRLLVLLFLMAGPVAAQDRDTLDLQLVLDPREPPLEGEMVLGTLRGIYRETITNEDLKLRDMTDFAWSRLGQDDWSDQRIEGRAARVFERRIAFFPQRPGMLEILPIAHELEILDDAGRRERVIVRSAPVPIEVEAKPAGADAGWLPVRALELSETWSADPAQLEDGQSVVRRVVLRALGATPEMMPEQPQLRQPWLIAFTPPFERDFQVTAQGPVTTLVWTWQLRPITGEPGVIPAVTIPYFDTGTRQPASATIPAAQIGYASFSDNAATGWRKDPGVGRAHLALVALTTLLVTIAGLQGRAWAASAWARSGDWLRRRRQLRHLSVLAGRGDVRGFRSLAKSMLGSESLRGEMLASVDEVLFGRDRGTESVDLRQVYRDICRHLNDRGSAGGSQDTNTPLRPRASP
ncbi:hypothetical protein MLD63_07180 [Paracoccus sp. TK19116]|uniref:Oxygen tolerance protein BatD n=1 Tax=Paracoccus albicereus TaxID=2922394 RepID=A0ABT1MTL4_9RHOB|nr:hypothetical protein [Paracoccus albicereus]MCQ0970201.1 hypothetical protein [Paracoccus albicereus]